MFWIPFCRTDETNVTLMESSEVKIRKAAVTEACNSKAFPERKLIIRGHLWVQTSGILDCKSFHQSNKHPENKVTLLKIPYFCATINTETENCRAVIQPNSLFNKTTHVYQ